MIAFSPNNSYCKSYMVGDLAGDCAVPMRNSFGRRRDALVDDGHEVRVLKGCCYTFLVGELLVYCQGLK